MLKAIRHGKKNAPKSMEPINGLFGPNRKEKGKHPDKHLIRWVYGL